MSSMQSGRKRKAVCEPVMDQDDSEPTPMNDKCVEKDAHTNTCSLDMYASHLGRILEEDEVKKLLQCRSARFTAISCDDDVAKAWKDVTVQRRDALGHPASLEHTPTNLEAYGVKPRLRTRFAEVSPAGGQPSTSDSEPAFHTSRQASLFSLFNSYHDVLHAAHPYPVSATARDDDLDALLLHIVNHVFKKMDIVKKNNERVKEKEVDKGAVQDQGFVRPVVLILAPMRVVALQVVQRLLELAQRENRADSIQGKERLLEEFGKPSDDGDDAIEEAMRQKKAKNGSAVRKKGADKPLEHRAIFEGSTDDHFRLGIKVTRGAVRLFTEFYSSDIVVASPLALVTRLNENAEDGADFLSSIEIAACVRADIVLMQNWAHLHTVMEALNRVPRQQHGTDIMRVREWALNEQGRFYRQTVLLSSFVTPEMNALFGSCCSHAGQARLLPIPSGVLNHVRAQVRQIFRKFAAADAAQMHDARFAYFTSEVWPRVKEASQTGLLIFASSYFDFVRLRNFLKAEGASFATYSEYTKSSDVMRARHRFLTGERNIMLYSERAHFYFRPKIRGVKDILFYSLPEHGQYYSELVNLLHAGGGAGELHATIQALFCACDALALARVVGQKRAKRMIADSSTSFLFT